MRILFLLTITTLSWGRGSAQLSGRTCSDFFSMHKKGELQLIHYCSNYSLDKSDTLIHTLLIYIHGLHRKAENYFEYAKEAVNDARQKKSTLVLAPLFADAEDLDESDLGKGYLVWKGAGWKDGFSSIANNQSPGKVRMSSYEVLDSLITAVLSSDNFPGIHKVIVVGHSAGGQFVQRYSAISPIPDLLTSASFRFIVMDPSSYMYPDNKRPNNKGEFVIPDSTSCPLYNNYPKGLNGLNNYAVSIGASHILYNMLHRDIVFLLGEKDTRLDDPDLDVGCAAELQGEVRLQRGLYYIAYLSSFKGYAYTKHFNVIRGVGHSAGGMINSPEARNWIFFAW